jgi:hypothetical protein
VKSEEIMQKLSSSVLVAFEMRTTSEIVVCMGEY